MSKQESIEQMIDALNLELDQTELDYEQAMQKFKGLADESGIDVMDLETKVSSKGADFSGVLGKLLGIYSTIQALKKQVKDSGINQDGR